MYRTMLDLIKPKLVYLDLPLFMALLSDLFPGVELPQDEGGQLRKAIEETLIDSNLQASEGREGGDGLVDVYIDNYEELVDTSPSYLQ